MVTNFIFSREIMALRKSAVYLKLHLTKINFSFQCSGTAEWTMRQESFEVQEHPDETGLDDSY